MSFRKRYLCCFPLLRHLRPLNVCLYLNLQFLEISSFPPFDIKHHKARVSTFASRYWAPEFFRQIFHGLIVKEICAVLSSCISQRILGVACEDVTLQFPFQKTGQTRLRSFMQHYATRKNVSVSESLCASLLPLRVDAARTNRRLVTCNVDKRAHRTYWLEVSGHVDGSRPHQSNSFKTVAQCLAWCRHFHFCKLDIARVFQVLLPQPDSPKAQMSMKMQEQTATML